MYGIHFHSVWSQVHEGTTIYCLRVFFSVCVDWSRCPQANNTQWPTFALLVVLQWRLVTSVDKSSLRGTHRKGIVSEFHGHHLSSGNQNRAQQPWISMLFKIPHRMVRMHQSQRGNEQIGTKIYPSLMKMITTTATENNGIGHLVSSFSAFQYNTSAQYVFSNSFLKGCVPSETGNTLDPFVTLWIAIGVIRASKYPAARISLQFVLPIPHMYISSLR